MMPPNGNVVIDIAAHVIIASVIVMRAISALVYA